ncbi:hypothetical protein HYW76_04990 [Candidatus Pacearchaeota archaeon]|nr:hypothetical protein [Candidatus Pacearchaeota archaeon]
MKKLIMFILALILLGNIILAINLEEFALKDNRLILVKGDTNLDGRVDVFDLAKIGQIYGEDSKSEDWDWKADIANSVGKIDVFDLAVIGMNYGMVYKEEIANPVFIKIENKSVLFNQEFAISVNISTEREVYAVDFILEFNPEIVRADEVEIGNFFGSDSYSIVKINNSVGRIEFAITKIGTSQGTNGTGEIAKIIFHSRNNAGNSEIEFNEIKVIDANLNEFSNIIIENNRVYVIGEGIFIKSWKIDNNAISPNNDGKKDSARIEINFSKEADYNVSIVKNDEIIEEWSGTGNSARDIIWDGINNNSVIEGEYIIRIEAEDGNLSMRDETKSIIVDITPPVISIDKEPAVSYNSDSVRIIVNASDSSPIAGVLSGNWEGEMKNYSLDGDSYEIGSGNFSNQESVSYSYYAVDEAENENTAYGNFIVENRAPILNIPDISMKRGEKFKAVNLENYSYDLDWDSISYRLTGQSNTSVINCFLAESYLNCSIVENGFGISSIIVEADDGIETIETSFLINISGIYESLIESYSPEGEVIMNENEIRNFNISYSKNITINWYLDGVAVSNTKYFSYSPGYNSSGMHNLSVFTRFGENTTYHRWNISVNDYVERVSLKAGKNYFSLPRINNLSFSEINKNCLIISRAGNCSKELYSYNSSVNCMNESAKLYPTYGYVVEVQAECYLEVYGNKFYKPEYVSLSRELKQGWNLIGGSSESMLFENLVGNCTISEGPWGYKGKRYLSRWNNPGEAYFIKLNSDCELT